MRWLSILGLLIAGALPAPPSGTRELARRLWTEPAPPIRSEASLGVAEVLLDELPPEELERRVTDRTALVHGLFGTLGEALARADGDLATRLGAYLNRVTRARSRRLTASPGGFTQNDTDLLLAFQLVDLERFVGEAGFRRKVLALLPGALDPAASPGLRERLLYRFNQLRGVDFDAFEDVAWAWGAVARKSSERRLGGAGLLLGETEGPILASVYSMPPEFFTEADASKFLSAVRRAAPERTIVVLSAGELHDALAARESELALRLVETWGFPFTPWPRDPMTFLRAEDGRRAVLTRPPNASQGRPEDSWLGRALVQGLPADLDASWKLHWRRSSFPFHNGQILTAGHRLWVTLHTLEFRSLAILGLERVPVERFAGSLGRRYLEATRQAAGELGELYGREVAFVHPLPSAEDDPAVREAALLDLGAGAGFDLDSILTLLPGTDGPATALVADPRAGARLVEAAGAAELDRFAAVYGLTPGGDELRERLVAGQNSPRVRSLGAFLDLVAEHLEGEAEVRRLPLLVVARSLQRDPGGMTDPDFLVGWNNVVLEVSGKAARAEGFASLLESGDDLALGVFGEAGYRLDLFPPLIESVVLNGGYRCASQHLR